MTFVAFCMSERLTSPSVTSLSTFLNPLIIELNKILIATIVRANPVIPCKLLPALIPNATNAIIAPSNNARLTLTQSSLPPLKFSLPIKLYIVNTASIKVLSKYPIANNDKANAGIFVLPRILITLEVL